MNNENSKYPFFDIAAIGLAGDLLVKPEKPVTTEKIEDKNDLRFDMTKYFPILLEGQGSITGDR